MQTISVAHRWIVAVVCGLLFGAALFGATLLDAAPPEKQTKNLGANERVVFKREGCQLRLGKQTAYRIVVRCIETNAPRSGQNSLQAKSAIILHPGEKLVVKAKGCQLQVFAKTKRRIVVKCTFENGLLAETPTDTGSTATPTRTKTPTKAPATATRTPTKTPTKAPATATRTPTKTPTKVPATATFTKTPTKVPVTATFTKTPTKTPTKVPATPTRTKTPTKVPATATFTKTPTKVPATPTRTKTPTKVPATPTLTNTNTPVPTCPTVVLPPPAPLSGTIPQHEIGVRRTASGSEFYSRVTGNRFVMRGNNYVRLATQRFCSGILVNFHSTFNPLFFDVAQSDQMLGKMSGDGYNTVRVFVNYCCQTDGVGNVAGGLSQKYVSNLAAFLRLARDHHIYVILTIGRVPQVGGYSELEAQGTSAQIRGKNITYLTSQGIRATERFWTDLIKGLQSEGAPLQIVLSYEIENESYYVGTSPPFTLTSGMVTTANGKTYDLGSFDAKLQMADENFVNWVNRVRAAILEVDPTALVTFGFFPSARPTATSGFPDRFLRAGVAIADPAAGGSTADWVDVHIYPNNSKLDNILNYVGITPSVTKPIVLGEFGATKDSYRVAAYAGDGMVSWQMQSCRKNFQGWLFWQWDTTEQPNFFHALEANETINSMLKPVNRPDACQPWPQLGTNIALNASVTASLTATGQAPTMVNDGAPRSYWGAGATATQWIELDLKAPQAIDQIRLVTQQSGSGTTMHRIWARAAGQDFVLLKEFTGATYNAQVLDFIPATRLQNIQYVRVETIQSVGTVAWREIEILQR